ncbi:MAG: DNA repair protein RecO [Candidatus Marinimicrobia bacterium]|nr:DNA repair protein RecO [Candidatus Neomarinimicrobiota bacterium]MCF7829201.1 DNA repair protein RecO [Candidatus Neomarinimicrobiota bacterium]MCF7881146.1 DNA repair protein RecO [Candidatus Neomarinimicrobiota bacterium]
MAIVTTDAVVLRRIEHSETSLICTFYTRDYGRLTAIAKGARRQKSQFAGTLDLMNYLQITAYTKETREVQTLSDAEFVRTFNKLQRDMDRAGIGMVLVETMRKAIIGEEPHPEIFDLLVDTLIALNDYDDPGIEVLWWFHLHLASLLGFLPQFDECYECGKSLFEGYFSADTGQIHCKSCVIHQPGMVHLRNMELRILRYLLEKSLGEIDFGAIRRVMPEQADGESHQPTIQPELLTGVIVKYLQYHVEGIATLQSLDFFTTFE